MHNRPIIRPKWCHWAITLLIALPAMAAWRYVETPHFKVYSEDSKRGTAEVVGQLELFHQMVMPFFGGRTLTEEPTTLVIFKKHDDFAKIMPDETDGLIRISARGSADITGSFIAMSGEANWRVSQVTAQDLHFQGMMRLVGMGDIVWFSEGGAELFKMFELRKKEVIFGRAPASPVQRLRASGASFSLQHCLALNRQSWDRADLYTKRAYRDYFWLLMHYCMISEERGDQWREAIVSFAIEIQMGETEYDRLLRKHLGAGLNELQAELVQYMQKSNFRGLTLPRPPEWPGQKPELVRVDSSEMDDLIKQIQIRVTRDPLLLPPLLKELENNPRAQLYEMAGLHAVLSGNSDLAIDRFQHAVDLGTEYAFALRFEPQMQVHERLYQGNIRGRFDDAEASRFREQLQQALALNPSDQFALEHLAWVEALAETPSTESIQRVQQTIPKLVQPQLTVLAIGVIRWRAGDFATARTIAERYAQFPNWRWNRMVKALLAELDATQANPD